ncbi:redoxin domain-containing protein [Pedobacter cryoconitis]|uniref:AhpC/TSA family protein n=1 Tax=Pedobacter cryoconitis TaxID=188932 RepID=A0A327SVT3_9SPHI|nr:redoxin domain-containing protein [Pedobacter cryoconitis]RAJ33496.1 AhpC/TSA family protein [Pedobacter cryoconitis]
MIKNQFKNAVRPLSIAFLCLLGVHAKGQDVSLKIHLSGVSKSKITLQSISGSSLKTIAEKPVVKNGEIAVLQIPKAELPAEFVLRFDYQEKETSNPYPAERHIFINQQNLELWARPKALNHPDSTYFQKEEIENTLFVTFSKDNEKKRAQLGLLQNFLMNYDQPDSKFFTLGTQEYEQRRLTYNSWIKSQIEQHKATFISSSFPFQYVSPILWKGTETDRMNSVIEHYFDGMDFKNPLVLKTADLKDWMDKYVNIYGAMSTTVQLRDSLFTLAGKRAIEKVRTGHPLVYGWMVDYFYTGFESFNMTAGIKMLEPYLNDPLCLTAKRKAIEQRLKGMETLVNGSVAPDFSWTLSSGKSVQFHAYKTEAKYKLVLFWSAECQHCKDLLDKLHPWYQQAANRELMDVFAISLDETETEIPAWEKAKVNLPAFKHKRAAQGIRSPEASAYFVLSTPTLVLVDAKTNKIVAQPETVEQLQAAMK